MQTSDAMPWLATSRNRLREARDANRLPHAVLLLGPPEIGKQELARWLASLVLCTAPDGPCGHCAGCGLFAAGNHPDLRVCGLLEDAASIKVEQIRELIEAMTLKSYLGGYKVAILSPADRMNTSSFNALLKVLEEPPDQSLLILTAARLDAIPITVASRCQRLGIAVPPHAQALAWLEAHKPGGDWALPLALAGGVPGRALRLEELGIRPLFDEIAAAVAGRPLDVVAAAARWAEDRPAERLRCLEQWLVGLVRHAFSSDPVNNSHRLALPTSGTLPDIRALIRLIDATREVLTRLEGQFNLQLMLEALLVRVKAAFG